MRSKIQILQTLAAVGFAAVAVSGCGDDAIDPADIPPLPPYVQDLGLVVSSDNVFWLNDHQIYFKAVTKFSRDFMVMDTQLQVYDIDTGEITGYSKNASEIMCVNPMEGRAIFRRSSGDGYMIGPPGQEQHIDPDETEINRGDSPLHFNPYSCEAVSIPHHIYRGADGLGSAIALLSGDGYLSRREEEGTRTKGVFYPNYVQRHHLTDADPGTVVPFVRFSLGKAYGKSCSRYAPFKGAYYLGTCTSQWNGSGTRPTCKTVWWFWPKERRWEQVCLADMAVTNFNGPTRLGYVSMVSNRDRQWNPRESGVYLQMGGTADTPGRVVKLVAGVFSRGAHDVSPDGCKVAFFTHPPLRKASILSTNRYGTLKFINLCKHEDAIRALPTFDLANMPGY